MFFLWGGEVHNEKATLQKDNLLGELDVCFHFGLPLPKHIHTWVCVNIEPPGDHWF